MDTWEECQEMPSGLCTPRGPKGQGQDRLDVGGPQMVCFPQIWGLLRENTAPGWASATKEPLLLWQRLLGPACTWGPRAPRGGQREQRPITWPRIERTR